MAKRNNHTMAQRLFIVRHLAAYQPPRAIVLLFAATFPDTRCDENDVLATDPESNIVAPELYAEFRTERARVMDDPDSAPYAKQKARLIALSNDAKFYAGNNQLPERRAVFRQIAEELGVIGAKGGKAGGEGGSAPSGPVTAIELIVVDPKPLPAEQTP